MIDLATLGIEVRSASVPKAIGELQKLRDAGNQAEQSTRRLGQGAGQLEQSFRRMVESAKGVDRSTKSIIEMNTGLDRASKSARDSAMAFEEFAAAKRQVDLLSQSIDPLYAATRRYEAAVETLNSALRQGVITQAEYARQLTMVEASFGRSTAGAAAMGGALGRLGSMSGETRAKVQQLAFQAQDMAVQFQAGTAASVVLAQQGSQAAAVFGPLGAIIGVLAAVGIPALSLALGSLASGTETAADAIDRFRDSVALVNELAKTYSAEGLEELRAKYGEIDAAVLQLIERQKELAIANAQQDAASAIRAIAEELGVLGINLDAVGRAAQGPQLAIRNVGIELGLSTGQATALARALQDVADADSFPEQAAALARVNQLLSQSSMKTSELYQEALSAEDAMRQLANSAPDANWMNAAISGVGSLIGRLWEAVTAASVLRNQQTGGVSDLPGRGRGGDPRTMGGSAFDIQTAQGANWLANWKAPSGGSGGGGGGGSGGSAAADEFTKKMEQLEKELQTEQERVAIWYEEGQALLEEALERKRITQEDHNEMMLRLNAEHLERMSKLDSEGFAGRLSVASDFFSDLADLSQSSGGRLMQISKAFAAAEALVNTYRAASQTLADPKLGFFAKFAAVAKVIAAGMGLVRAIRGGGSASPASGGAASGSSGSVSTSDPAASPSQQLPPQRVIIDADSNALFSPAMMQEIFTRFYDINKNRGVVFQVNTA